MRRLARPLLYVGTVAIVLGMAKIHARYIGHYDFTGSTRFVWTMAYIGLLGVSAYGSGLPDLPRTGRQLLVAVGGACVAAVAGMSLVQVVTGDALLPRFVVFGAAVVAVPWWLICAALARGGRLRAEYRDRVVLVAAPSEAMALRDELAGNPERHALLVATLSPEESRPTGRRSKPLTELAVQAGANLVVLDRAALAEPAVVSQAAALHEHGLRVRTLSLFYEEWIGKLPLSELERTSLLFDIREVHGGSYVRVKRLLDLVVGVVGLVPLGLAVPVVLVANAVGNRGPLFFRQQRVGKNDRPFTMVKFRTMRDAPEQSAGSWTQEDDPRVTRFGRVLRKTHLDELPQVVNILRGDLSLVGPRPEQPRYVEELVEKLPYYGLRHLVRPGLTGWAQVKYGYAGDERDALEKLQYEFWYLRRQSLVVDARIVGRTIRSVFGAAGAGR
jgi:lipopolysaccharide/colanic/teichoic acid biosynthesis glycosyltransferase